MKSLGILVVVILILVSTMAASAAQMPTEKEYKNSFGMRFVRIEPGTFEMGQLKTLQPEVLPEIEGGDRGGRFDLQAEGDYDERPIHTVAVSKPFYMGVYEVTNKQYELFDPEHRRLRDKRGLSKDDDDPVIYVNWYEAQTFCQWLSHKEGLSYRLPTEVEWEYACRAGTTTNYYMADVLPKRFEKHSRGDGSTTLKVGETPANNWGLYDMHGNVEEWCHDWYGPYVEGPQQDPVGYAEGDFRVTRGGSYDTYAYFLRSANRMGMPPADRNWVTGFRVVIGEPPETAPMPAPPPALNQRRVVHNDPASVIKGPDPDKPYFKGPRKFVKIPREAIGPVFAGHNHNPAIVECPNGDLLACWYTCVSEKDRELAVAASRLRFGEQQWQQASAFWDAPDRNDHAPVLWYDGAGKLYHFQPYSVAATYATLAVAMRTSADSGATWSRPRIIIPDHNVPAGHQLSEPAFRMNDGAIAITTDGFPTLWISKNEGLTWRSCGGDINGNHPGIAQLADGRLIGFLRNGEVEWKEVITEYEDMGRTFTHKARKWRMARCYSSDTGKAWTHEASPFPGVDGGQRLVLLRLREGPLFLASFANRGMIITDSAGDKREVRGMFAALSEDGGKTWPYVRLVSDDGPGTPAMTTNGGYFAMSARNAEYRGYMSGCQGLDGVIHLVSSYSHYSFNLAWLKTPAAPLRYPEVRVRAAVETFDGPEEFDLDGWEPYHGHSGGFNGRGQYTMISKSHFQGMNRLIGAGSFEMDMAFENICYNPRGRTASPGITIWIKDAMMRRLHFYVRDNRLSLGLADEEEPVRLDFKREHEVRYSTPPKSAKLKFIYNEDKKQVRIFYGLNGAEARTELPHSKVGIYFGKRLSESTAAYIMMSNGRVDLDYFEIKPISP
ncbi:MAG: SUMF1/EgtB/PvdO family nonheme iron enzyme [Planctomycetota bacterium]|jgi:formylglycine-generating enzyme required for sulfatase activity